MAETTGIDWEGLPLLHLYEQSSWHEDGYILGNRKGLEALRDAISAALDGKPEAAKVTQNDGEFYHLTVRCVGDAWMSKVPTNYGDFPHEWSDAEQKVFMAAIDGRACASGVETDSTQEGS